MENPTGLPRITEVYGAVRKVSGTDYWIVEKPFVWWLDYFKQNENDPGIVVPEGFKTNFGSIPRAFWWVLNPTEWNAYVLHDYMYSKHYFDDRIMVDYVLYKSLVAEGCSKFSAKIILFALLLF